MRQAWPLLGAASALAACAGVLGIPDGTPSFCAQPANQGHAYCEDFDVGDASSRWTFAEALTGATYSIAPSSDSPPNLLDLSSQGADAGSGTLAGFTKEFDDATFVGLHIEADVRFVTQNGAPMSANGGFLLVVDKSGGCIGLGVNTKDTAGPNGIGAVVFADPTGCSRLVAGGGGGSDAAPTGPPKSTRITDVPPPNTWFHVIVVVSPDPSGSGAGTVTLDIVGQPTSSTPVPLEAGTLTAGGIPLVGFAAEVNDPSGPLEVQFDNIWIDLRGS